MQREALITCRLDPGGRWKVIEPRDFKIQAGSDVSVSPMVFDSAQYAVEHACKEKGLLCCRYFPLLVYG